MSRKRKRTVQEQMIFDATREGDYAHYRADLAEARKKKPRIYKDSNIWTYRAAAVQWLRYGRHCPLVSIERGMGPCTPDVLGCDKSRFLIEVEIKRTVADFRNNAKKESIKRRDACPGLYPVPKFFYFLVAPEIMETVKDELPHGAGLLSFGPPNTISGVPDLMVVATPKAHPLARRLDAKELVLMAKAQSGTLFSILKNLHRHPELCAQEGGLP